MARVSAKFSLQCFPPGLEAKHNNYLAVPVLSISQLCQAQPEQLPAASQLLCFTAGKLGKAEEQQQRVTTFTPPERCSVLSTGRLGWDVSSSRNTHTLPADVLKSQHLWNP